MGMEPEKPEKPEPEPDPAVQPEDKSGKDEEIGEFINRQILEKDTVFFEG